ncbi:MAG: SoxR reducing system RseC family protein [Deltaproteobacteria bacterium]|nr:SoxR reducing system RseC family protein [Deltaproteobacteria bacterium]
MATELGTIIKIKGETAMVRTRRMASCEGCSEHDVCHGTGNIKENEFEATNPVKAVIGDTVVLEFNSFKLIKLSFLLYVFPIIALITGAVIGDRYALQLGIDKSLGSVVAGFIFFAAAMGLIMILERKAKKSDAYKPEIIRVKRGDDIVPEKCDLSGHSGGFKSGRT